MKPARWDVFWWNLRVFSSRIWNSFWIALKAPFVYSNLRYFFFSRLDPLPGVLKLRNGIHFHIRPHSSDPASITDVNIFRSYSQPAPGSIVVDVGANIGAFSLLAGQTARKVYAVEPIQSNYDALCRNIQLITPTE